MSTTSYFLLNQSCINRIYYLLLEDVHQKLLFIYIYIYRWAWVGLMGVGGHGGRAWGVRACMGADVRMCGYACVCYVFGVSGIIENEFSFFIDMFDLSF